MMFIKICAVSLLCLSVYAIISQLSSRLSFSVKLSGAILLLGGAVALGQEVVSGILSLLDDNRELLEYAALVLKATGIAILAQICADICKDAGHASLGDAVMLAGKLEIVLLCLPIIKIISAEKWKMAIVNWFCYTVSQVWLYWAIYYFFFS